MADVGPDVASSDRSGHHFTHANLARGQRDDCINFTDVLPLLLEATSGTRKGPIHSAYAFSATSSRIWWLHTRCKRRGRVSAPGWHMLPTITSVRYCGIETAISTFCQRCTDCCSNGLTDTNQLLGVDFWDQYGDSVNTSVLIVCHNFSVHFTWIEKSFDFFNNPNWQPWQWRSWVLSCGWTQCGPTFLPVQGWKLWECNVTLSVSYRRWSRRWYREGTCFCFRRRESNSTHSKAELAYLCSGDCLLLHSSRRLTDRVSFFSTPTIAPFLPFYLCATRSAWSSSMTRVCRICVGTASAVEAGRGRPVRKDRIWPVV